MYGYKAVMPEDILLPDWHTNPLFFGAYSNWPIGMLAKPTFKGTKLKLRDCETQMF